jgi:hypothetical protein
MGDEDTVKLVWDSHKMVVASNVNFASEILVLALKTSDAE